MPPRSLADPADSTAACASSIGAPPHSRVRFGSFQTWIAWIVPRPRWELGETIDRIVAWWRASLLAVVHYYQQTLAIHFRRKVDVYGTGRTERR